MSDRTSRDGWFSVRQIRPATYCLTEALGDAHPRFGSITTHSYVVLGSRRAALIDAGFGIGDLRAAVREITDLPIDLCISHGHWDHYGSAAQFASIMVGAADGFALSAPQPAQMQAIVDGVPARCARRTPDGFSFDHWGPPTVAATRLLTDGDVIELGGRTLTVVTTPGHTAGSVCYLDQAAAILFTGDTVMRGDMHVDLTGSDEVAHLASLAKLRRLKGYRIVCPAHFATPLPATFVDAVAEHVRSRDRADGTPAPADFDVIRAAPR
jgi:glyoxylase-like metal-dependent hydrolase (beta-lactamase superfamily II)